MRLAVPVDDDRAPDDALQRAAGRGARALRVALLRAAGGARDPAAAVPARPRGDAAAAIDPRELRARPDVFERLDVPTLVLQPEAIAATPYGSAALAGATRGAVRDDRGGRRAARRAPGLTLPLLGPDRRRRPPARARPATSSIHASLRGAGRARRVRRHAAARHRRPRPDRRARVTDDLDVLWPPLLEHLTQRPGRLGARLLPARRRARDSWSHELARGSASAPRSTSPRTCSRTPARACSTASPTSACSPRPAGWSGCAPSRAPSALQGPPRRPHARGGRRPGSASMSTWRPASATPKLDPDTDERFVSLRRELGRHELRHQPDPAAPRPARAHPPPHDQEEVFLVLAGTLTLWIEGEPRELGQGELARVGARGAGASSPTATRTRTAAARARRRTRARRPRRRGVRVPGSRRPARRRRRSRCPRTSRCDRARRHAARGVLYDDAQGRRGGPVRDGRRRRSSGASKELPHACCYEDGHADRPRRADARRRRDRRAGASRSPASAA